MAQIVGNLDCESEFAAAAAGGPRRQLGARALRTLSDAGTLLRAFAEADDRLWTPLPVDRSRLPAVAGIGPPRLITGRRPTAREGPLLAWAAGEGLASVADAPDRGGGAVSIRRLAAGPVVSVDTAASVHHRSLALELARELDCALPGARPIESIDGLRRHLAAGGAEAGDRRSWVVKAPFSASGRLRVVVAGGADPKRSLDEPAVARRIERLLAAQGWLLFEPWMRRVDDWACLFRVGRERTAIVGVHRILVSPRGRFDGIAPARSIPPSAAPSTDSAAAGAEAAGGRPASPPGPLTGNERRRLLWVAGRVAEELRRRGYRGPAGIDAWRYRRAGRVELHPLGEINARLTFGWVWRAWRERLERRGDPLAGGPIALRLGAVLPPPSGAVRRLLLPAPERRVAAWLEAV